MRRMVRRGDRQDRRRGSAGRSKAGRARHTRAGRRGGGGGALEFSAADGGLEVRAGARGRQQRGAEAFGEIAADGDPRRQAGLRRRHSRRRVQRAAGRRRAGQAAGAASRRRLPGVHRLDRGRQADHAIRRPVQPQARLAGARRQVAQHRAARLPRPGPRGRRRGRRDLLQHGRDVHGRLAPAGASRDPRAVRRQAAGSRQGLPAGPSARPHHLDGCDHRPDPARAGARLHRDGAGRSQAADGRQAREAGQRRPLCRADRIRDRGEYADRARGDLRAGAVGDRVRHGRRGDPDRQRQRLRARGRRLDRQPEHRPRGIATAAGGHRLGQLLRRGRRHEFPVRRLQAIGQWPGQVAACAGEIHRAEIDADPAALSLQAVGKTKRRLTLPG
ncbi:hypothetical protein BGLA2_2640013 [Burkholderia gladioli]|nr:hypothetical protein BGLA2_2640013 [Burkholderia gladioli]